MARWVRAALVLGFFYILFSRFASVERLALVARRAVWYDLLLAILLQALFLWNQAGFVASVSRLTHRPLSLRRLLAPVLATNFVNAVAPSAALAGAVVIAAEAEREGMARAEAVLLNVLYLLLDYAAFLLVLAGGLTALALRHDLARYEWVAAGLLVSLVALAAGGLVFAVLAPGRAAGWAARLGHGVHRRLPIGPVRRLTPERVEALAEGLAGPAALLRGARGKLLVPALHALGVEAISIATLWATFLAFRHPVPFGALIGGYAVGTLFLIVSITPSGVGVVEGVMALTFVSLGIDPETSAVVTLVYRGLTFWLPFVVGFLAFRRVRAFELGCKKS